MVVYKCSDRVPVRIGEITVWISPLSGMQKAKILSLTKMKGGQEIPDAVGMALLTLKMAVKAIDCPEAVFADGDKVELKLDPNGELDDESLDVLLQVADNDKIITVASMLAAKGLAGWEIPGVKVDFENVVSVKKKPN